MRYATEHDYLVELCREPSGEVLAQERLEDLGHLVEEARYESVSRRLLPDDPQRLRAELSPLFEGEGPFLRGVRVCLSHVRESVARFQKDFPKEIAKTAGTEIVAQLLAAGRLQKDESFRIRLACGPRVQRHRHDLLAEPEAEVQEAPFPVVRQALEDFGITPDLPAHEQRPVYVTRSIVEQARGEAVRHGNLETGTLLLGHLIEDPKQQKPWSVVITEQMAVPEGQGTAASFTFPSESLRKAKQLGELRGRGERVIGSQHSHGWRCHECGEKRCEIRNLFFSTDDVRMAELFPVFAVFLVMGGDPDRDRDNPVPNLYVRLDGTMQAVPFAMFG